MLYSLVFVLLFSLAISVPLEPGQPGGPWTEEEIDIVRAKVNRMMECQKEAIEVFSFWLPNWPNYNGQPNASCWTVDGLPDMLDQGDLDEFSKDHEDLGPRATWSEQNEPNIRYKWRERGPKNSRLIQLAFHDCLRYEDGTGGCDGCINWAGVGHAFPRGQGIFQENRNPDLKEHMPRSTKTNNNKLQLTARSLELIYTVTNWPPGAPVLTVSLKESGKSRADLWQFAGNVGLENAIGKTNDNCRLGDPQNPEIHEGEDLDTELLMSVMEGLEGCEIKLNRPLPFKWGRTDCIPDESEKWTPYDFEATKTEKHSNTYGTGNQVVDDLKGDFDLTARETISLMATHGLNQFTFNFDEVTKYKWAGGSKHGSISRMYYKMLNGKTYEPDHCFGCNYKGFHLGDVNGDPVDGPSYLISCHDYWKNDEIGTRRCNGPCHFRFAPGCQPQDNPDLERRQRCFEPRADGAFDHSTHISGCETAELIERNGFLVQKGGPPASRDSLCKKRSLTFVMPYEMSFVMNFTIGEHHLPSGCGHLESDWWTATKKKPDGGASEKVDARLWIGSPGFEDQPPCGKNTYAPEGEATADIVRLFAEDHEAWQESFFNAWEKMQQNGYHQWELTQASDNGHLLSQTEWYTDPMAGCASPNWAADSWCDDENNNAECNNFDGGACCNNDHPTWNDYCTDCECLQ